jgi:hypothetical protein
MNLKAKYTINIDKQMNEIEENLNKRIEKIVENEINT